MALNLQFEFVSLSVQVYKTVKAYNDQFSFMQCTSAYPLNPEDVNLRVIQVSVINRGLFDFYHMSVACEILNKKMC